MRTSRPRRLASSRPALATRHRIGGLAEDGDAGLAAEHPELLDGGRTLEVGTDQQRVATLLLEPAGQLGRRGGLARALQAGQQDDRRRPLA